MLSPGSKRGYKCDKTQAGSDYCRMQNVGSYILPIEKRYLHNYVLRIT